MIDINDARNQHLLAHPHFLAGIKHERERIIAAVERFIDNPHSIEDDCDSCNIHRAILALIRDDLA